MDEPVQTAPDIAIAKLAREFIDAGAVGSAIPLLFVVATFLDETDWWLLVGALIWGLAPVLLVVGGFGLLRGRDWSRRLLEIAAWPGMMPIVGIASYLCGTVLALWQSSPHHPGQGDPFYYAILSLGAAFAAFAVAIAKQALRWRLRLRQPAVVAYCHGDTRRVEQFTPRQMKVMMSLTMGLVAAIALVLGALSLHP
jgi:hypothetical protein